MSPAFPNHQHHWPLGSLAQAELRDQRQPSQVLLLLCKLCAHYSCRWLQIQHRQLEKSRVQQRGKLHFMFLMEFIGSFFGPLLAELQHGLVYKDNWTFLEATCQHFQHILCFQLPFSSEMLIEHKNRVNFYIVRQNNCQ